MPTEITFDHPHRRAHFDFFRQMDQPHFSVCAPVRLDGLVALRRARQIPFTPAVVFLLSGAANAIPALRQRIRGERVVEHERVSPSFAVRTDVAEVFSFCFVPYRPDFDAFVADAQRQMERMRQAPSFADEPDRDDYLFMSALPWVAFTAVTHPMHYSPVDSVPRITWGKYEHHQGVTTMPVSIQAHHALVDGWHLGRFFELVQERFAEPERFAGA